MNVYACLNTMPARSPLTAFSRLEGLIFPPAIRHDIAIVPLPEGFSMQNNFLDDVLRNLLTATPSVVVYAIGIIFAIVQMKKAPKGAVIVIISLVVLGLLSVVQPFVWAAIGRMENRVAMFSVAGLLFRVISLAGIAGLVLAVFCDRQSPATQGNPYAGDFASFPPQPPPSFPGPAPLPPLGGSFRPPQ